VAQNVGVWLSGTDYPWTERIRSSNAVHTIGAGLVVLMLPFAAAHAISILPFMGLLSGLLNFLGTLAVTAAILAGFGAVLLTRGGRVRDTWNVDPEDAWAAALDDDPVAAGETPEPAGSDTASGPAFEDSEGDPHA